MSAQLDTGRYRILVWQTESNRSRWVQTNLLIKQWITERQALLVSYNEICQASKDIISDSELQTFCQLLIDYVSMGHFKVFERLAETQEIISKTDGALEKSLLDKIYHNTQSIVDFNDTYAHYQNNTASSEQTQKLTEELSHLGQLLANRMDWEDKLIQNYMKIIKLNQQKQREPSKIEQPEALRKTVLHDALRKKTNHLRSQDKIPHIEIGKETDSLKNEKPTRPRTKRPK